jgi:hypothetical protein
LNFGRPISSIPVPAKIDGKKGMLEVHSYRYKNKVIVRISLASQASAEVVASKISRAVTKTVQQIFQEAIGQ